MNRTVWAVIAVCFIIALVAMKEPGRRDEIAPQAATSAAQPAAAQPAAQAENQDPRNDYAATPAIADQFDPTTAKLAEPAGIPISMEEIERINAGLRAARAAEAQADAIADLVVERIEQDRLYARRPYSSRAYTSTITSPSTYPAGGDAQDDLGSVTSARVPTRTLWDAERESISAFAEPPRQATYVTPDGRPMHQALDVGAGFVKDLDTGEVRYSIERGDGTRQVVRNARDAYDAAGEWYDE